MGKKLPHTNKSVLPIAALIVIIIVAIVVAINNDTITGKGFAQKETEDNSIDLTLNFNNVCNNVCETEEDKEHCVTLCENGLSQVKESCQEGCEVKREENKDCTSDCLSESKEVWKGCKETCSGNFLKKRGCLIDCRETMKEEIISCSDGCKAYQVTYEDKCPGNCFLRETDLVPLSMTTLFTLTPPEQKEKKDMSMKPKEKPPLTYTLPLGSDGLIDPAYADQILPYHLDPQAYNFFQLDFNEQESEYQYNLCENAVIQDTPDLPNKVSYSFYNGRNYINKVTHFSNCLANNAIEEASCNMEDSTIKTEVVIRNPYTRERCCSGEEGSFFVQGACPIGSIQPYTKEQFLFYEPEQNTEELAVHYSPSEFANGNQVWYVCTDIDGGNSKTMPGITRRERYIVDAANNILDKVLIREKIDTKLDTSSIVEYFCYENYYASIVENNFPICLPEMVCETSEQVAYCRDSCA